MGLMFKVYAGPWIIDFTIARQHNTNHSQILTLWNWSTQTVLEQRICMFPQNMFISQTYCLNKTLNET